MNQKLLDALVKLFGDYPCDIISPMNQKSLTDDTVELYESYTGMKFLELISDISFATIVNKIRPVKKQLEFISGNGVTSKNVLIGCLQYAWLKVTAIERNLETDDDKFWIRIFEPICLASFNKMWSEEQKTFFKETLTHILEKNVYFISYTNKLSSIINNDYYESVCKFIPPPPNDSEKFGNKNLLAESISKWLRIKNFKRGFYDNKSLPVINSFDEKLELNCKNSFILIQLIDSASFMNDEHNWSFEEFKYYYHNENRNLPLLMLFYVTESTAMLRDINYIYPDYWDWYGQIAGSKRVDFFKDITDFPAFKACMEKLFDNIHLYKKEWFDKAPVN